jgi:hypothetical protein
MEISREDVRWNCGSTRSDFREFIGGFILSTCNVVELETVKLVLKASYLLVVGFHLGITTTRALLDLADHELGVTTNVEALDP